MIRILLLMILSFNLYATCLSRAEKYGIDATKICSLISYKSKIAALDKNLVISIVEVESAFKINATNGADFGLMQVNYKTIKSYGFSKQQMLLDASYALDCGIKVLLDKKKMWEKKDPNWFIRYNTGNRTSVRYGKAGKDYCRKLGKVCRWKNER